MKIDQSYRQKYESMLKKIGVKACYLLIVFVLAMFIRLFLVELYKIDSASMENSLCVGDFIVVNKMALGAKLPKRPTDVPFLEVFSYLLGFRKWAHETKWDYHRLPGLGKIKRNDIVVFDDKQQRDRLIKRCIGLPGDTLSFEHNKLYINGKPEQEPESVKFSYKLIKNKNAELGTILKQFGLDAKNILWKQKNEYHISMTASRYNRVRKSKDIQMAQIDDLNIGGGGPNLFGYPNYKYTRENFGPIIIPAKGQTISLNLENIVLYRDAIGRYEGNELKILGKKILINNFVTERYKFKLNYFFVAGDNRYFSIDSRYWGFVPESFIIGKMSFHF